MRKWFCEEGVPGKRAENQKVLFKISRVVYEGRSKYQKILIFDNPIYGRVFVLDGIVQLTEKDEFVYHEMLAHIPMFTHPKPERVLIIGGGDGGVLREVLKHPVEAVELVEIDRTIPEVARKYLRFVCRSAFRDKRVNVYYEDGIKFLRRNKGYDVIIIDSTSPIKHAKPLFSSRFYKYVYNSLRKDGVMMTQLCSFLDFSTFLTRQVRTIKKIFPIVKPYRVTIPSYNCGEFCFLLASKRSKLDEGKARKRFKRLTKKSKLRYYSLEMHKASEVMPNIWKKL